MKYLSIILLLFSITTLSYAEDEVIELTTYYPAPYGEYESLETTDFKLNPTSTPNPSRGQVYYNSGDDNIYYNTDGTASGWSPMNSSGAVEVLAVDKIAAYNPNPTAPKASKKIGKNFKLIIITGQVWANLGGYIWKDGTSFKALFHCGHIIVENTLTSDFSDTFIESGNNYATGARLLAAKVDASGEVWLEQGPATVVTYAVIN